LADGPLWALGTACAESLELGCSAKSRGREKKFSVSPVPSATVGKAFADGLIAFAESFRLSAKPGFPFLLNFGYFIYFFVKLCNIQAVYVLGRRGRMTFILYPKKIEMQQTVQPIVMA
jgi:hypothetical protein